MQWRFSWLGLVLGGLLPGMPIVIAADCAAIDLRDKNPGLGRYFYEPFNQRATGWCYAFAAADLVAFATGKKVSPIWIGDQFDRKNQLRRDGQDGGYLDQAVNMVLSEKSCSSQMVISSFPSIDWLASCVGSIKSGVYSTRLDSGSRSLLNPNKNSRVEDCVRQLREFPQIDLQQFEQLIQRESPTDYQPKLEWVGQWVREQFTCEEGQKELVVSQAKLETFRKARRNLSLGAVVDQGLERGHVVGIDYYLELNQALAIRDVDTSDKAGGLHSSVIVGRKLLEGQCSYLVRNSWGRSCRDYTIKIKARCIEEEGSFWLTRAELQGVLERVHILR